MEWIQLKDNENHIYHGDLIKSGIRYVPAPDPSRYPT